MKTLPLHFNCCILFAFVILSSAISPLQAQGQIAGLDTNGISFQVNSRTGEFTTDTEEAYTSFSLGGTARKGNKLYYVVVPSGSTENAIYTVDLNTDTISHVDLDRSESVRAMFFKGRKLYGIFYDGTAGSHALYRIDPSSGATTLVLDLADLDLEPIPGAFAPFGRFYYVLAKPEADSAQRRLLRFKAKSGSAQVFEVVDSSNNPVLCDKLKPKASKNNFVCLASNAGETQVSVCRMTLTGKATCLATLDGIERIGGGHTMLAADQKVYYAFVYAPGEPDNQRLIKFNSRGAIKSNLTLSTISIGAHFAAEPATLAP
ncbi:MAG: hypothetical protein DCC75_02460 [Proteobacteria bacterium]|nr:MAG: hypothetical protein DCC75_02460 [Pseudomonadota bacterium]